MSDLRYKTIKLAYEKPELREDLLPLLKTSDRKKTITFHECGGTGREEYLRDLRKSGADVLSVDYFGSDSCEVRVSISDQDAFEKEFSDTWSSNWAKGWKKTADDRMPLAQKTNHEIARELAKKTELELDYIEQEGYSGATYSAKLEFDYGWPYWLRVRREEDGTLSVYFKSQNSRKGNLYEKSFKSSEEYASQKSRILRQLVDITDRRYMAYMTAKNPHGW